MNGKHIFHWNWLWALLFAAGLGIFLIGMPKYADDWAYMIDIRGWFLSQGIINPADGGNIFSAGIPINDIVESWRMHDLENNRRLGNILVMFFLLLPKWIGSGLALFSALYALWGLFRICGIDWQRCPLMPLGIALFCFALPWYDHMGSLDFQFNYVIPSGLAIGLLLYLGFGLQQPPSPNHGHVSRRFANIIPALAFGFIVGAWHEGISAAIAAGLCAVAILFPSKRSTKIFAAIAGLALGLLFLAGSHGIWNRLLMEPPEAVGASPLRTILNILIVYIVYFAALALLCIVIIFRRNWRSSFSPAMTFLVVSGMVPLVFAILTDVSPRVGWWSCLSATGIILLSFQANFPDYFRNYRTSSIIVSAFILALTFWHQTAVAINVITLRNTFNRTLSEWTANPDKSVFGRVNNLRQLPPIAFRMPDDSFFTRTIYHVSDYYWTNRADTISRKDFAIIPEELRNIESTSGQPIPGGSGIRQYLGHLFTPLPEDSVITGNVELMADYGKGFAPKKAKLQSFRSERDGRRYAVVTIEEGWFVARTQTLRAIAPNPRPLKSDLD